MTQSHEGQRTQVGIIGAGPAGLLLAHLLHLEGIDSVVIEARSRSYIESRIRAGVLEHPVVELLVQAGVGERLRQEGLVHEGIELRFAGGRHRIDFAALTGKSVTVYGQHEVVKDLVAARLLTGRPLILEASDVAVHDIGTDRPRITYRDGERRVDLHCDVIAGCDGFHGISRPAIPAEQVMLYERAYPFGWLGILAEAPPAAHELIYVHHANGFALTSMRSPTISRHYLQCPPDAEAEAFADEAIWDELDRRLDVGDGARLARGPILQKGVTAMRSFVCEPMRYGRLFLAGDAAHIVPPTGAKGMNLAVADVRVLAQALTGFFRRNDMSGLDGYSSRCLRRIWAIQRFSWWMTSLLHRFDDESPFDRRRQLAELEHIATSRAAAQSLAETYVGLPFN